MNIEERAERIIRLVHGERASGSIAAVVKEICEAQREAMQKCAVLLEHAALPTDEQIQEWRERESTKKLGNLEYDEEIAFCHADLCADRIRVLSRELGKE